MVPRANSLTDIPVRPSIRRSTGLFLSLAVWCCVRSIHIRTALTSSPPSEPLGRPGTLWPGGDQTSGVADARYRHFYSALDREAWTEERVIN
jgi:hypothetical protein